MPRSLTYNPQISFLRVVELSAFNRGGNSGQRDAEDLSKVIHIECSRAEVWRQVCWLWVQWGWDNPTASSSGQSTQGIPSSQAAVTLKGPGIQRKMWGWLIATHLSLRASYLRFREKKKVFYKLFDPYKWAMGPDHLSTIILLWLTTVRCHTSRHGLISWYKTSSV